MEFKHWNEKRVYIHIQLNETWSNCTIFSVFLWTNPIWLGDIYRKRVTSDGRCACNWTCHHSAALPLNQRKHRSILLRSSNGVAPAKEEINAEREGKHQMLWTNTVEMSLDPDILHGLCVRKCASWLFIWLFHAFQKIWPSFWQILHRVLVRVWVSVCMFGMNGSVNPLAKTFVVAEKQTNSLDYDWLCENSTLFSVRKWFLHFWRW